MGIPALSERKTVYKILGFTGESSSGKLLHTVTDWYNHLRIRLKHKEQGIRISYCSKITLTQEFLIA